MMRKLICFVMTCFIFSNSAYAEEKQEELFSVARICEGVTPGEIQQSIDQATGRLNFKPGEFNIKTVVDQDLVIRGDIEAFIWEGENETSLITSDTIKFKVDCKRKKIQWQLPDAGFESRDHYAIKAKGVSFDADYELYNEKVIFNDIKLTVSYFAAHFSDGPEMNLQMDNLNYSAKLAGGADYRKLIINANLDNFVQDGYFIGPLAANFEVNPWDIHIFSRLGDCLLSVDNGRCSKLFWADIKDVVIRIKNFSAKTKEGGLKVSGYYSPEGSVDGKRSGDLKIVIPQKIFMRLAMKGCESKLKEMDPTVDQPDIQYLCDHFLQQQVIKFKKEKLYTEKAGVWSMRLQFDGDNIVSNGKKVVNPGDSSAK